MTITLERALNHMAWANQKVYAAVATLPDEAFEAYIVNPEWSAGRILQHIVGGADWYQYRLVSKPWSDIPFPKKGSDVIGLAEMLAAFDKTIIEESRRDDESITQEIEGKSVTKLRSTIITQAVHHATEHRAQLIDALEYKGYKVINLDDIDLWSFESAVG